MTAPVNSATAAASAIAALLRHAVAAPQQVASTQRSAPAGQSRKAATKGGTGKHAQGQMPLADLIAKRAEELNPDAPDYRRRLLRLVIEATLLHELGSHLLNAPKFQSMVDQVLADLDSSPHMQRDVTTVLDDLAKGHWPKA